MRTAISIFTAEHCTKAVNDDTTRPQTELTRTCRRVLWRSRTVCCDSKGKEEGKSEVSVKTTNNKMKLSRQSQDTRLNEHHRYHVPGEVGLYAVIQEERGVRKVDELFGRL